MELGLSTVFARGGVRGADPIVDLLSRAGASCVLLDAGLSPPLLDELSPRLLVRRDELPVRVVENVCPGSRRALAELCALDDDEAAAAVAAAIDTVRLAGTLGATHVLVRLGEVAACRPSWPAVRRAYLRGELAESATDRASLVADRVARGRPHVDRARRALDRLARACESHGVTLGLRNPSRYLGLPFPAELRLLVDDLRGAPVAPALDVAALHLNDAMGLLALGETLDAWREAQVVLVADACAQLTGLLPGRGELDLPAIVQRIAPEALCVFHPGPASDEKQLLAGMDDARRLLGARPAATAQSSLLEAKR